MVVQQATWRTDFFNKYELIAERRKGGLLTERPFRLMLLVGGQSNET